MPAHRAPKKFQSAWNSEWDKRRMRWLFYVLDPDEAKLKAILDELAPAGYRLHRLNRLPKYREIVMSISKLEQLDKKDLDAEILRVHTVCERHHIVGLDDIDVEDPAHDDLGVN
jgi:hypothetical protein